MLAIGIYVGVVTYEGNSAISRHVKMHTLLIALKQQLNFPCLFIPIPPVRLVTTPLIPFIFNPSYPTVTNYQEIHQKDEKIGANQQVYFETQSQNSRSCQIHAINDLIGMAYLS